MDISRLIEKGINLDKHGINGYCFDSNIALRIVSALKENNILVVGGDVVRFQDGEVIFTYTNWSIESDEYDVEHGATLAIEMIKKCEKIYSGEDIYYILVTKSDLLLYRKRDKLLDWLKDNWNHGV